MPAKWSIGKLCPNCTIWPQRREDTVSILGHAVLCGLLVAGAELFVLSSEPYTSMLILPKAAAVIFGFLFGSLGTLAFLFGAAILFCGVICACSAAWKGIQALTRRFTLSASI